MNTLTSALRSRFLLKNGYSTTASAPPTGFTYLSNFLDKGEQVLLTKAALTHLDNVGSSSARRKLKRLLAAGAVARDEFGFLPEDPCYQFEEGHFDGVIRNYREARITDAQWAALGDGELARILNKLRALLPRTSPLQFQVLHLSSKGEILPHIDNVGASGSTIIGLSLGSPRVFRLEDQRGIVWEQTLEPGSCYIQRDAVRYRFRHSILNTGPVNGTRTLSGQRLSVVIRDMPNSP